MEDFYCETAGGLLLWNSWRTFNVKQLEDFYCETTGGLLMWNSWRTFNVKQLEDFYCETAGGTLFYLALNARCLISGKNFF